MGEVDPSQTVGAIVWKHAYGSLFEYQNLKILVNLGAGVDHILGDPYLPPGVPIVRLVDAGLTARMSEYVLMHCLSLHRLLPEQRAAQVQRRWSFIAPKPTSHTRIGILGFGKLGRSCADLLGKIGFQVVGWKRTSDTIDDYVIYSGRDGLFELCASVDIVVSLLPFTPETRDLLDRNLFESMRRGVALINVGRGDAIVDQDLLSVLDAGQIRHAVLDSSSTDPATALEQVSENIRRAITGQALLNVVDVAAGY